MLQQLPLYINPQMPLSPRSGGHASPADGNINRDRVPLTIFHWPFLCIRSFRQCLFAPLNLNSGSLGLMGFYGCPGLLLLEGREGWGSGDLVVPLSLPVPLPRRAGFCSSFVASLLWCTSYFFLVVDVTECRN